MSQDDLNKMVEQQAPYLDELAEALHVAIRHADPDWQWRDDWAKLDDDAKEFYADCVQQVLCRADAVSRYYEIGRPTMTS